MAMRRRLASLFKSSAGAANARPTNRHGLTTVRRVNGEIAVILHQIARAHGITQLYYEDGPSLRMDR